MATKNTVNVEFNYNCWSCPVNEDQMTNSTRKMKKLLTDDIVSVLTHGYKRYGDKEPAMKVSIPFFPTLMIRKEMKVNVAFDEECKFKTDKFSRVLKTRTEFGEITVEGPIKITITWKV